MNAHRRRDESDPGFLASSRRRGGVGLGRSESDLIAAYGDQLYIEDGISADGRWATVRSDDPAVPAVKFTYVVGGPVTEVAVGASCAD